MDEIRAVKIGEKVPELEFDVYLPEKKDFGRMKLLDCAGEGKWMILFFYPADYTFVCPTELADAGEKYGEFAAAGAEIVSMSTDTHFVHYAWRRSEKLLANVSFPMGADPSHVISKSFGVYDEASGLALRGTFIVDPDGVLMASEVNNLPVGRNADELLRKFLAFKHVRENPAQVCPAKWSPGGKTLVPGKDLVGRVGEG